MKPIPPFVSRSDSPLLFDKAEETPFDSESLEADMEVDSGKESDDENIDYEDLDDRFINIFQGRRYIHEGLLRLAEKCRWRIEAA